VVCDIVKDADPDVVAVTLYISFTVDCPASKIAKERVPPPDPDGPAGPWSP